MGNFTRNNRGFGKRKFKNRPAITQIVIWGLVMLAAVLFFITSFGYTVSLVLFLQGLESGILMLIAILLVASAVWSREDKDHAQKKRLANKLRRQKNILKKRFDAKQNLAPDITDIQPSLNFAVDEEQKTVPDDYKILDPKIDQDYQLGIKESQLNLAKILIEGENLSSFPAEWQQFFVENEGKEPIEKLNSMLKNGKKAQEE